MEHACGCSMLSGSIFSDRCSHFCFSFDLTIIILEEANSIFDCHCFTSGETHYGGVKRLYKNTYSKFRGETAIFSLGNGHILVGKAIFSVGNATRKQYSHFSGDRKTTRRKMLLSDSHHMFWGHSHGPNFENWLILFFWMNSLLLKELLDFNFRFGLEGGISYCFRSSYVCPLPP